MHYLSHVVLFPLLSFTKKPKLAYDSEQLGDYIRAGAFTPQFLKSNLSTLIHPKFSIAHSPQQTPHLGNARFDVIITFDMGLVAYFK